MHIIALLISLTTVLCAAEIGTIEVKAGSNYGIVRNELLTLGYKDTGLEMAPMEVKHELKFMANDKHVLMFLTDKSNTDIITISLYISDFGPKAHRFDRQYSVESIFIKENKLKMVILPD